MSNDTIPRGYTVPELAQILRVSEEKIRGWIARRELGAVNTGGVRCGRPRYVVLPHQLAEFERRHAAAQPKPAPRRRKQTAMVDFFPDVK